MKEFSFKENGFKKNDRIWHITEGWVKIDALCSEDNTIICNLIVYQDSGKRNEKDKTATIFPNKFTAPETAYTPSIKDLQPIVFWDDNYEFFSKQVGFYNSYTKCPYTMEADKKEYRIYDNIETLTETPEFMKQTLKDLKGYIEI